MSLDISTLEPVLDAVQEAVFVLGEHRKIRHANRVAREQFGEVSADADFIQIIRQPDCIRAINEVLANGESAAMQFSIENPLRATFNMNVAALSNGEDAARHVLVSLRDISDLRQAAQMRSDFVANVSHELRSPLTAISGFIETLKGPARDDPEAQIRFLGLMETEAARMVRLIADLLSLSKVEASQRRRPDGFADPVAIMERVITSLGEIAKREKKRVRLEIEGQGWSIPGSEDELTQAVQNLLENAIKYAAPETEITVRLFEQDQVPGLSGRGFGISFQDRGEGIPKEHIGRLTERFYRVDTHRSRDKGGTGLGLAIVKHIVNRHRGRLQIESEPGSGSTFTIYLPLA